MSAVVTEHGTIKAPVVLCAAGAWTSMFCRSLGISLPQLRVRGTVVRTAPGEQVMTGTDTGIDLSAFRLGRFFDGTKMQPYLEI